MSTPPTRVLVAGQAKAIPVQCNLPGSNQATGKPTPSTFNADDVLTASVFQSRQTTAVFAMTPIWYTANDTQTGYGQGQVECLPTAAQMAMLVPTTRYTLDIWRTLSSGGDPDHIARVLLLIEPLAIP